MRIPTAPTLALILAAAVAPAGADVVTTTTFEAVPIPATGYLNDSDPGLVVDGNLFSNSYSVDPKYGAFWSGWAFSDKTDATTAGFGNQYSAITGEGADGSANYAVLFGGGYVNVAAGRSVVSMDVTNTTYAYLSMKNGDPYAYSKKFGPGDFFTLHVKGFDGQNGGGGSVGEVDFNLADFLNGKSTLVNTWQTIDLTSLAAARSLVFSFTSSDNGDFGMNTPAYAAVDDFRTAASTGPAAVPEPTSLAMAAAGLAFVALASRRGRGRTTR